MPQFTGTNKEFNEFLGGYCRNRANQLAKKYRKACNKTCQYCKKTNVELESAHVNGIERRWIIQKILDDNFKTGESIYSVDLNKFSELYDNFHMPISEHFYFLCKDCHTKYDRKKISDDEIKLVIENNGIQNLIRENVSRNTADKSNQLEDEKVQDYVKRILQDSYNNGLLNEEILTNLQDSFYCKIYLGMCFPLLTTDYIKTFDANGYSRYYKKYKLGDKYYLCDHMYQKQKALFENFFKQLKLDMKNINNKSSTCGNISEYDLKKETYKSENKKSSEDEEIIHLFKKFKHEICKTDLQDIDKKIEFEIETINKILKLNNISGWKELASSEIFYKLLNKYENLYKSQHNNSTKIYLDALNDFKWFVKKLKFNNNSNTEKFEIENNRHFKSYSTKNNVAKSYLYSSLQLKYSDYLSLKYSPNTILTYCSSINRVMYNENYESWEKVAQNIDKLLIDYDKYGCKSELGQHGHASVINALRRFKEFLLDTKIEG